MNFVIKRFKREKIAEASNTKRKEGSLLEYYNKEEVGKRIQEVRKRYKMTQEKLADKLEYSNVRQLQRIENGENGCTVDKLMEIAQILHTTTDYLLFGIEAGEHLNEPIIRLLSDKSKEQKEYAYLLLRTAMDNLVILSS